MPPYGPIEVASARRSRGLLRLAENNAEALAIDSDPWDFAVSVEILRLADGLTHADLLWLLREGLVEHAVETTAARKRKRAFRHGGTLRMGGRICFVISEPGLRLARGLCTRLARLAVGDDEKPAWNETEGKLSFLDRDVLDVKRGDMERAIVQQFHDLGWPTLIDDPLTRYRGDHSHRRRNALIRLNDRQNVPLLRFFTVVGFDKIGWFPLGPRSDASSVGGNPPS